MLTKDVTSSKFTQEAKAPAGKVRLTPCLININDESVLIIGGKDDRDNSLATASLYKIESNTWVESLP